MNFNEALTYLYQRLPMFQRVGAAAIKKDLTNTLSLLKALGDPHHGFRSVHIAGTNGKGTSAHALAAVLQSSGYKTGLYTSPHLKSFTERIKIDGREVPGAFVAGFVTRHQSLIEQVNPSFFEVTVAMAFDYFHKENVDIAIIETGLGGRLDSTNVIAPEACLITMIGWDHADLLGDTLEKIAGEKAGIIKPQVPVVIGADQPELLPVFQHRAGSVNAPLHLSGHYRVALVDKELEHQVVRVERAGQLLWNHLKLDVTAGYFLKNLPGILTVLDVLKGRDWNIPDDSIVQGLGNVRPLSGLKGRWQVLNTSPAVVADVSHNESGLKALFDQVKLLQADRLHLVMGVVRDKDLKKIFPTLPRDAAYYFTQSSVPRSLGADELKMQAREAGLRGEAFPDVNEAIWAATDKAGKNDLILVCGSTFVVAEIDSL